MRSTRRAAGRVGQVVDHFGSIRRLIARVLREVPHLGLW
jgi:hypothetical protein